MDSYNINTFIMLWTRWGKKEKHKEARSHVFKMTGSPKTKINIMFYTTLRLLAISCSLSFVSQTFPLNIVALEWLISVVFCSRNLTVITRTEFTLKFPEPWGQVDTWTSLSASNNNDITTMLIPHAVSFIGCCANCKMSLMFLEIPKLQLSV